MTAARKTSANAGIAPRVFISYARSDGEQFAAQLRHRLEAEHIPLWQDRVGMEGGRDWWQQITGALDAVEFMVLVMTLAALRSEMVRKEWRYARQQGGVRHLTRPTFQRSAIVCDIGTVHVLYLLGYYVIIFGEVYVSPSLLSFSCQLMSHLNFIPGISRARTHATVTERSES